MHNSSTIKAYETSSEARRKAQLKTEETIADLKMLHGFSINDDESVLPPELQLEIESIQKTNDALIEQTESYEQNLITESESNETKNKNDILNYDNDSKSYEIYILAVFTIILIFITCIFIYDSRYLLIKNISKDELKSKEIEKQILAISAIDNVELSLKTEKILNDLNAIVNIDQLNQDNTVFSKPT